MQSIDHQSAVYEAYLAVPDHQVAEIIDGDLVVSPRPAIAHARTTTVIGQQLAAFDAPGGWWLLDEPELRCDANILVPDLAGWRRERMPSLPGGAHFTKAPDWVCEVLSPGTAKLDRARKLHLYGASGVEWIWLVDPLQRALEVYRSDDGAATLVAAHDGAGAVRAEPFAAVALAADRWWG